MWSSKKSVQLSLILTDIFLILAFAACFSVRFLVKWYIDRMERPEMIGTVIIIVCYICLPFAFIALISLHKLLTNIKKGTTFVMQNVKMLRILSWCCVAVALTTLVCGYFYLPFYIVGIAAAFFALIIRIIKNVFCSAIEIKAENELTI